MNILKNLDIENVVFYKKASLDLDYQGITVIKGLNKNARNGKNTSNGSGKSMFFGCLPQLVFASSPLSTTSNKRLSKKSLLGENSKISLDYNDLSFIRESDGKSFSYKILKNGVDQKVRTAPLAESFIRETFPLNEEEFYTLVYLDSRRQSVLQMGGAAQRMEFFTNLFHLNNFDETRKLFNSVIRDLRDDQVRHDTLLGEVEKLKAETDIDIKKLREMHGRYQAASEKMTKRYKRLHGEVQLLNVYKSQIKIIEKIHRICKKLGMKSGNLDSIKAHALLQVLEEHASKLRRELKAAIKYSKYKHDLEAYKKGAEKSKRILLKHKKYVEETVGSISTKEVKAYIDGHKQKRERWLKEAEKLYEEISEVENEILAITTKAKKHKATDMQAISDKYKDMETIDLEAEKDARSQAAANSKSARQALHDFLLHFGGDEVHDAQCPTCSQNLNTVTIKRIRASLEHDAEKANKRATKASERVSELELLVEIREGVKRVRALNKQRDELKDKYTDYSNKLEGLGSVEIDVLETFYRTSKIYRGYVKPTFEGSEPKRGEEEIRAILQDCEQLETLVQTYLGVADQVMEAREKWDDLSEGHIEHLLEQLTADLEDVELKMNKVVKRLPEMAANIQQYDSNVAKRKEHEKEIKLLARKLEDMPVYEMLVDAYSTKGLKMLMVQKISHIIESNLNLYADLLFREPFTFKFLVGKTNFDILVSRKAGKKIVTSDVRQLSGAESRAFNLLTLLAILPLIPSQRRLNLLVLDEPTANLDDSFKDLFINSFLPKLNTLVPHIVVITPLSNEHYPSARNFVAVKQGPETKLLPEAQVA